MKVLIAGGTGEVGRYLVKEFLNRGNEVVVLDRSPKQEELGKLPIRYYEGNLRDRALVEQVVNGMDVIVNLAWSFADDPGTIFQEDIEGHITLLEAASRSRVRHFIYTSTATVYGRAVEHPVTENHPCLIGEARKPLYALGKYTAEELTRYYHKERGLPATIFRFWWAFGENIGGRHLRDLVKKSLNHQPLEMVRGAGGTFITMEDLSRAIELAITVPDVLGETYNVGSLFLTWEEIAATLVCLACSDSAIRLFPSDQWKGPAFLNEVWDLSSEKAKRQLGFKPGHPEKKIRVLFEEALRTCVDQVREG